MHYLSVSIMAAFHLPTDFAQNLNMPKAIECLTILFSSWSSPLTVVS